MHDCSISIHLTLFCIKCKFTSDPKKIVWICTFCKKEFQCNAKIFNTFEFKLIKITIKEALLNKIPARPVNVPCCGDKAFYRSFRHKKQCQGELYCGDFKGKSIVVCSKCKSMSNIEEFLWTCPKCEGKFTRNVNINSHSTQSTVSEKDSSMLMNPLSVRSLEMKKVVRNKDLINDNNQLSPYVKKNVLITIKNSFKDDSFDERAIQNLKRKEETKRLDAPRNHSVHKFKNEKVNKIENNDFRLGNISKLIPIKEEDFEIERPTTERPSTRLLTDVDNDKSFSHNEKSKNTPFVKLASKKIELSKNTPYLKLGSTSKIIENNLKSNSNIEYNSCHNNEKSNLLSHTSANSKINFLVSIPNNSKIINRVIDLKDIKREESSIKHALKSVLF